VAWPLAGEADDHDAPCACHASCVVCLDAPRTHVLVPCGHRCVCEDCCNRVIVLPDGGRECPMCREPVLTSCLVYL